MSKADRSARAAFVMAAGLWLAAWPRAAPPPASCPQPVERRARDGHTREVACDGVGDPLRGPARLLFGRRLDLNRADVRTLEVLPGIGPARARAIVAARSRAPFARVEDLERVPGLGPVSVARLRDRVEVIPGGGPAPRPISR